MADIGFRAVLSVNDGFNLATGQVSTAGNTQVVFPDLVTVGFPKRKVGEKDVTAHDNKDADSNPDFHKKYIPTLIESDLVPVEIHYTAAALRRLDALLGQAKIGPTAPKVPVVFVVNAPPVEAAGVSATETTPQKLTFTGYVASLEGPVFAKEDEMVLKFELRVNGKPKLEEGGA